MKKIILFFVFFGINLVAFTLTPNTVSQYKLLASTYKQDKIVYPVSLKKINDKTFSFYNNNGNYNIITKDNDMVTGGGLIMLKENN